MLIDGRFRVEAPPERVLALLFDVRLMASCLPGCESLEAIDDDRYRAIVAIAMAGIKARFELVVEVTAREASGIRALTRGEEGGQASTLQATSEVRLVPDGAGTLVDYRSDVGITGRLGRFALGMMKKKAQAVGDEFAANLQERLGAGAETAVPAATARSAVQDAPVGEAGSTPAAVAPPGTVTAVPESTATPATRFVQRLLAWMRRLLGSEDAPTRAPH